MAIAWSQVHSHKAPRLRAKSYLVALKPKPGRRSYQSKFLDGVRDTSGFQDSWNWAGHA